MSSNETSSFLGGKKVYGSIDSTTTSQVEEQFDPEEKVTTCTVFESTCNLVSLLSGSGMLSLPFAAAQVGWSALFLLVLICALFMYSFELLATSVEGVYEQRVQSYSRPISYYKIDYLTLGKLSFGKYGDKIVMIMLGTELALALVSFFINIGISINVIYSDIPVALGILIAATITCIMSFANLKTISVSSALGLLLTLLIIIALFASGYQLTDTSMLNSREYTYFNMSGLPISLGLIAFCFGGHGVFPTMYTSMRERHRYREVLWSTAAVILCVYIVIMAAGYAFFAQYTQSPLTKNIGKNLHFENTPHGAVWRILAPLGIACNIQVTCPLVVLAVRDMAVKLLDLESTVSNQRYLSVFLLMVVTPVACSMSSAFPAVCGFIGSFATIFSSILLPMLFYHTVYRGRIALSTTIIHTTILIITLTVTAVGMYANFHSMFV